MQRIYREQKEPFFPAVAHPGTHLTNYFQKYLISLSGLTKGGLYAGATGGYGVGASAALGGNVDGSGAYGGSGAEAHAGGISTKTVKLSQTPQYPQQVCH